MIMNQGTAEHSRHKTDTPDRPFRNDADFWARPVDRIRGRPSPTGAIDPHVDGLKLTGPIRGFGQLWEKTYKVRLSGADVTPQEVIQTWKDEFPRFWPEGNRFYTPLTGIQPGEFAVLNLAVPGITRPVLSTGVMVIYADDESFTFMTPEGHMLSAWITFSAFEEADCTVAQAKALVRASDPITELGMRFAGHIEDAFWENTLTALAAHFGVQGQVLTQAACLDPRVQWSQVGLIWRNVGVRSAVSILKHSFSRIRNLFG
jgi:hypothetical protein